MRISWDLIRSFRAVSEAGSLSSAARKLGLTQPTIGRHIDLLEAELRLPLFIRSREGMALTERGRDLIGTAQQMSENATAFERLAYGFEEDVSGTLRISANEVFGVLIMPGLISAFMAEHPGIDIELVVSNDATNLLKRDADIAIRLFRPEQNDLVARKLTELPLGLYASHTHLEQHGEPKSIEDLRNHSFIGFDRDTSMIDAAQAMGVNLSVHDFSFRSDNILTHMTAVRSGVGIGFLHQGLAKNWSDVRQVLKDTPLPSLELWLACHADVKHNKRVRLMMDFLAKNLTDPYVWYTR